MSVYRIFTVNEGVGWEGEVTDCLQIDRESTVCVVVKFGETIQGQVTVVHSSLI